MQDEAIAGIDVSHYQGSIDWEKVKGAGVQFALMKASEGTSFVDPTFAVNWSAAKTVGIKPGAYHYFLPTESFLDQAELLLQCLANAGFEAGNDLPPAIDCEDMQSTTPNTYVYALLQLVTLVERFIGVKPMIYVSPSFWNELRNPDFSGYPLWLANYTESDTPEVPAPWINYTIWQYSETGQVDGVDGAVDLDRMPRSNLLRLQRRPALGWF